MRQKVIAVLDDAPSRVAGPLERWLTRSSRDGDLKFWEHDSTPSLVRRLSDPSEQVDLLLIDAWLQEGRGGLEALDLAARIRPKVPAVLYTSLNDVGERFMYALAAEAWFGHLNLKAIHPKDDTRDRDPDRSAITMLERVIDGHYVCPRLAAIRGRRPRVDFEAVFGSAEDVRRWRAVRKNSVQRDAAREIGISANALGTWEAERRDYLHEWWNDPDLGQATRFAGELDYFHLDSAFGLHACLHKFAAAQVFFRDTYVMNQRYPAPRR